VVLVVVELEVDMMEQQTYLELMARQILVVAAEEATLLVLLVELVDQE
jgi:hypothetical protein